MSKFKEGIKRIFAVSPDFKSQTAKYEKIDIRLALLLLLSHYALLIIGGTQNALNWHRFYTTGEYWHVNILRFLQILRPVVAAGLVLLFLRMRKQGIVTVGFTKKNIIKSLLLGAGFAIPMILYYFVFLPYEWPTEFFAGLSVPFIIEWLIWLIIVTSFTEELIYRGYLGTRLYGAMKSKIASIILVGFFFTLMHIVGEIPLHIAGFSQYASRNASVIILTLNYTVAHALYHWMYAKFNNIAGPILFHTLFNFIARAVQQAWILAQYDYRI